MEEPGIRAPGPQGLDSLIPPAGQPADIEALQRKEREILLESIRHEAAELIPVIQRFSAEASSIGDGNNSERLYDYPTQMRELRRHLLNSLGDFNTENSDTHFQDSKMQLTQINTVLQRPENLKRP